MKNCKFSMVLALTILIWTMYIIKVSGDFMEFRFFVPIMPLIYILISITIVLMPGWVERIVAVIFLLILSLHHAVTFSGANGIESIS